MDDKYTETPPTTETVRVNIFDQIYSLRSPKGAEHIRQIAELVDERMRQISAHTTTFELSRIAVLAALNIADELQDIKDRREEAATAGPVSAGEAYRAEASQPQAGPDSGSEEPSRQQTWFEAIFDAEVPVKERSERLSTQVSTKLQTIRQDGPKEPSATDEHDG